MSSTEIRYSRTNNYKRRYSLSTAVSLMSLKKKELRYIAKFLYNIDEILTENDEEIHQEMLLFLELCRAYGCLYNLRTILDWELEQAEKEHRIEFYKAEKPELEIFPVSREKYRYKIDPGIVACMPDELLKECNPEKERFYIDLYRVLISADKKEFQRILYSLFFGDGTINTLKYYPPYELKYSVRALAYYCPRTDFLKESVEISDTEAAYLNLMFYIDQIPIVRKFFNRCDGYMNAIVQSFLGISQKEFSKLIRRSGNLRKMGFLAEDGDIDVDIKEAILNQSIECYFSDIIKPLNFYKTYDLSSFSVSQENTNLFSCFLKGSEPCNLLLLGAPGAGKTEYAKALCKQSGLKAYIFRNDSEYQGSKILARINTFLAMKNDDAVLIVDEADKILTTIDFSGFGGGFVNPVPNSTKGPVNRMLEEARTKSIWIVNYEKGIDESTRRRFTYNLYFDPMSETQLRSIASSKLEVLGLDEQLHNRILTLFGKYKLSGSSVDNVVKGLISIGTENAEKYVEMILKQNSELQYGRRKMRATVNDSSYDLSVLNTSIPSEEIVHMIENGLKYGKKHPDRKNGIRFLFYGLSGTGKTELARYISQVFGKPLCLKRPSDIFGKYVGENEQNIAAAFAECERTGAILLFDEADSFFADRNQAEHSWERSTVNEFLTQMEEFNGILICTTNLRQILDQAMPRRFSKMVEFHPLTEDGIGKLLSKYFPDLEFSAPQIRSIAKFETATPGDFGTLDSVLKFMDEDKVNAEVIVEELVKIQKDKNGGEEKRRCIGFSA